MFFMLQKEVADRIVAPPGGADYGRLSVMAQAFFECNALFHVRPEAFLPVPRVDSTVVHLRRRAVAPCDFLVLERVVAATFVHRRKMLRHTLGRHFPPKALQTLGIRDSDRPEAVSVGQFIALAHIVGARA
jgi:16S rRNA (adenine1518-N6/adenine1519-N6)-dimethyltransferase